MLPALTLNVAVPLAPPVVTALPSIRATPSALGLTISYVKSRYVVSAGSYVTSNSYLSFQSNLAGTSSEKFTNGTFTLTANSTGSKLASALLAKMVVSPPPTAVTTPFSTVATFWLLENQLNAFAVAPRG